MDLGGGNFEICGCYDARPDPGVVHWVAVTLRFVDATMLDLTPVVNGVKHPQNPYADINAVLDKLGFSSTGLHHGKQKDHHNHFHVDLRAPERVGLPENLLVEEGAAERAPTSEVEDRAGYAHALLEKTRVDLDFKPGEVIMFVADTPSLPPQEVPVMIAQANQAQAGDVAKERAIGVCYPVPSNYYGGENTLSPLVNARLYLHHYEPQTTVTGPATLTVLQQPRHGILRPVTEADRGVLFYSGSRFDPSAQVYAYLPEKGYLGDDQAVFLVEQGGVKVKVVYFFQAVEGPLGSYADEEYCGKTGTIWKISAVMAQNRGQV